MGFFWLALILALVTYIVASLLTQAGRNRIPAVWVIRGVRGFIRSR
jgi:hypothetical protein